MKRGRETSRELEGGAAYHIVTLGDPGYPAALLETADPPLFLYAQGRLDLLGAPALAIVGSRHASAQGLDNARAFAEHLSRAGITIVSGMALGIDGSAHEGGLAGRGSTIAVVGTGLDRIYPARHKALAHRIAEQGLLVSEFELQDWWPNQLKVELLHQHSSKSDPMGGKFNYAKEFKSLDLAALKKDLATLMTDSQD